MKRVGPELTRKYQNQKIAAVWYSIKKRFGSARTKSFRATFGKPDAVGIGSRQRPPAILETNTNG